MSDQEVKPLGILDLFFLRSFTTATAPPELADHWYWCRRHEQAEHFGQRSTPPGHAVVKGRLTGTSCIRIGPFMSREEANILRREHPEYPEGDMPLDMEIER